MARKRSSFARLLTSDSIGGTITKIVVGLLFIIVSFSMDGVAAVLTGLLIGLGLIAWAVLPFVFAKREQKAAQEEAQIAAWTKREEARMKEKHAEEQARLKQERALQKPRLCPCCGATTKGASCEYCGRPLPLDNEGRVK